MKVRSAAAAIALSTLAGCASVAIDRAAVHRTALELVAAQNTAHPAESSGIGFPPRVFVGEYSSSAWEGSSSWNGWLSARRRYEVENGVFETEDSILGVRRIQVMGSKASVVLTSSFAFKKDGRIVREPGIEAFTLSRFGDGWWVDGYAQLSEGKVAQGEEARAVLDGARDYVHWLNTACVIPAKLVDSVLITDDLQDWVRTGPGGDLQQPHKAPLLPGDPDSELVLGAPLRLSIGRSDAFVVFSAALESKDRKRIKGRGRLGLVLGRDGVLPGVAPSWGGGENIVWVPE